MIAIVVASMILVAVVIIIIAAMAGSRWPIDPGVCPSADRQWVELAIIKSLKKYGDDISDVKFFPESLTHDDHYENWGIVYQLPNKSFWHARVDCDGLVQAWEATKLR